MVYIITAPEIEMLIILNEDCYFDFKKSGLKPSDFCKMKLKYHFVKSKGFVTEYFSNPLILLSAIKKYTEVSNDPRAKKR